MVTTQLIYYSTFGMFLFDHQVEIMIIFVVCPKIDQKERKIIFFVAPLVFGEFVVVGALVSTDVISFW